MNRQDLEDIEIGHECMLTVLAMRDLGDPGAVRTVEEVGGPRRLQEAARRLGLLLAVHRGHKAPDASVEHTYTPSAPDRVVQHELTCECDVCGPLG